MDKGLKAGGYLGAISVLLQFLAVLPKVALFSGLLSTLLLVISHRLIAKATGDRQIFRLTLVYVAASIAATSTFSLLIFARYGPRIEIDTLLHARYILAALLLMYVGVVIAFYHLSKAYYLMEYHTGISPFKVAGALLFYGSLGLIVMGLGAVVMVAGWITATAGYALLTGNRKHHQ